jgi:urease beta subunit
MEGRDIRPSIPSATDSGARFDPPPKRQVQVRFDPGDYEHLQMIAYRKGTKAAALIREAVKEIIRKDESST